jgi:hypothetical protein
MAEVPSADALTNLRSEPRRAMSEGEDERLRFAAALRGLGREQDAAEADQPAESRRRVTD